VDEALARYQAGEASDTETASLMEQLINTGSLRAVEGNQLAGEETPQVWAGIIPVGRQLDIWVDGERHGSASNVALARYRVVVAARPAKVTWVDPFTAHWERSGQGARRSTRQGPSGRART
jgi:hypothetical protein